MVARWLFVRLKAAEKALRQGRLDDVLVAVQQPDVRDHPRGQKLLDELVRPVVARARLHRQAGRYRDALADLELLTSLGRGGPDVHTLRQQIADELRKGAARTAEDQAAYARAVERMQAGRLESVRLDVQRVDDPQQRAQLAEELDHRVQRGGELLQQAAEALQRQDILTAARLWQETCQRFGRTRETDRFAAELAPAYRCAIDAWHGAGQLAALLAARPGLAALLAYDPTLADCERIVESCHRAAAQLATASYPALRQTLLRLKAARGDVAWVRTALDALDRVLDGHDALMASPLGLFASEPGAPSAPDTVPHNARPPADHLDSQPVDPNALGIDGPLLVLVDGGGSSLLTPRDQIRIGRAGSSAHVDVGIPADLDSHHADIMRRGEDYFLVAHGPALVNHQRVQQALLRDGDRIALGDNVRLTFHRPSARSESAVLRLSHRCRLDQDVSDIILFHDTCLIGPGSMCHVRTREESGRIVLFERAGRLHARAVTSGSPASPPARAQAVCAGQTLDVGGLRVTVKPYDPGSA